MLDVVNFLLPYFRPKISAWFGRPIDASRIRVFVSETFPPSPSASPCSPRSSVTSRRTPGRCGTRRIQSWKKRHFCCCWKGILDLNKIRKWTLGMSAIFISYRSVYVRRYSLFSITLHYKNITNFLASVLYNLTQCQTEFIFYWNTQGARARKTKSIRSDELEPVGLGGWTLDTLFEIYWGWME